MRTGTVALAGGERLALDTLPGDIDAAAEVVVRRAILFDPLDQAQAAEATPEDLQPTMEEYLREELRVRTACPVRFSEAGVIGEGSYWIYATRPPGHPPLFLIFSRIGAFAAVQACEATITLRDGKTYELSPAQAATLEYLATEIPSLEGLEDGGEE